MKVSEEEVKKAVEEGRAIIGFKKSLKFIKSGKPKVIIVVKNLRDELKTQIVYNAKILGVELKVFEGSSKEFGMLCGKPYPISVLVIK